PTAHVHADGSTCTGHHHEDPAKTQLHKEHKCCNHEHTHAEKPTAHVHADGSTCTGHHHEDPAKTQLHKEHKCCNHEHTHAEKPTAHVHADGSTCTGHHHEATVNNDDSLADMIPLKVDAHAQKALDMKFEKVLQTPMMAEKTLYGQLFIPPHAIHTYAIPVAGRVDIHVKSAQKVSKGDKLYTLNSPELVTQIGAVQQAKADLERSQKELSILQQRKNKLDEIGTKNVELNSELEFKKAELVSLATSLQTAQAQLATSTQGARLNNTSLEVLAQTDGTVQTIDLAQGAWAEQGKEALVVANQKELELQTTLFGDDKIHYSSAKMVIPQGKENLLIDGSLRIADHVDTATQARTLYFSPNQLPPTAYAGQLVRLDLYNTEQNTSDYINIPNSAIVKVGVNDVVFLKVGEFDYIMKKVETLPARRGKTPVKGLIPGQTMVTQGGYELKYILPDNGTKKPAAGHFHADGQFHEGEH
ncbi:MAG: efflux RND transporter periplasmic adaptor subunit, partial [Akkermansia sp.]|nr:efflux RND transporter periplasmic adaptor subunit [Akkermansia sp.]